MLSEGNIPRNTLRETRFRSFSKLLNQSISSHLTSPLPLTDPL